METQNSCHEMDSVQYRLGWLAGENRRLQEQTVQMASSLDAVRTENSKLHNVLGQKETENAKIRQDLETALASREDECRRLREAENALEAKERERKDLEVALMCREGECQQLRDKENMYINELAALRRSRAYRLGSKFAAIARFFVPRLNIKKRHKNTEKSFSK